MIKVVIVEDEIPAQINLKKLIEKCCDQSRVVATLSSVRSTVKWLEENPQGADVIFLDVELSDGICFDIFDKVAIDAQVIITTAYDNYALKAFEAGSIDYLLKPVEAEQLKRAVARCRMSGGSIDVDALARAIGGAPSVKSYKERYIIRFNDRIIPLQTSNIAYVFSEDKNNYMVTFDGQKYIIDSSLDVIAEELDPQYFFRISRSCIVSMKAIDSITKQMGGRLKISAHPEPSFEMTVSRSRVDDFLLWLEK